MIGKLTKGRGFRGLLNYLASKEGAYRIGGNMSGRSPRELASEFRVSRVLNPEVERAVYHVSLSLPHHERLSDDTWNEVTAKYLDLMGFTDNQYVVYRHQDTRHDHVHIALSRIRLGDGRCVHDGWDYLRSQKVIRQLEREYGLEQVLSSHEKASRSLDSGQLKRMERERDLSKRYQDYAPPQEPVKQQLQSIIDDATTDHPTMPLLIERLQVQGVEVRHGFTRTGKSKGISYQLMEQHFSGSQLGAAYTFPGLQKHQGVDYCSERDDHRIEQLLKYPAPATTNKTFAPWDNQPNIPTFDTRKAAIGSIAPPDNQPTVPEPTTLKAASEVNRNDVPHHPNEKWRLLYQRLCTGMEHLSLLERDKQIVKNLLQSQRQPDEIRDIILASPVKRTREQTKQLVIEALTEEEQQQERLIASSKQPQLEL